MRDPSLVKFIRDESIGVPQRGMSIFILEALHVMERDRKGSRARELSA